MQKEGLEKEIKLMKESLQLKEDYLNKNQKTMEIETRAKIDA